MKIAVVLNACGNTNLVQDSLEAIQTYVSKDGLMICDGAAWESWGKNVNVPINKMEGLYHNYPKAPYRNLTLGLKTALDQYPQHDWFCYCEPDVLFVSDSFKTDLAQADLNNIWCVGNDHRVANYKFPYLESILGFKVPETHYLLGCCVFYSGKFLRLLKSLDFYNRFLERTNDFEKGFFPNCDEQNIYDFGEHLYPTLAAHLGGTVTQFACWHQNFNHWGGKLFKKYLLRWKPEIAWEEIPSMTEASILHPCKIWGELRWFFKQKRKKHVHT